MFSTKSSKQAWTTQFPQLLEMEKRMHRVLLKSSEIKNRALTFYKHRVMPG